MVESQTVILFLFHIKFVNTFFFSDRYADSFILHVYVMTAILIIYVYDKTPGKCGDPLFVKSISFVFVNKGWVSAGEGRNNKLEFRERRKISIILRCDPNRTFSSSFERIIQLLFFSW